jgi:PilZ domain/Cornifin (SPRR) family
VTMPPAGLRRSSRVPKEIAILLVGSDMEGKLFSETTKTVLLSRHGAGILSKYALSAEQELIIRRLDNNKEAEVRLVGKLGAHDDTHTYGVAFLDPKMDLWDIYFPPMTETEKQASRITLECSGCKMKETVQQSELEADVYIVNEGIVRYCRGCGLSTFWKQAVEEPDDEGGLLGGAASAYAEEARAPEPVKEAAPEPAQEAAAGPAQKEVAEPAQREVAEPVQEAAPEPAAAVQLPARRENRRKHVRTKANFMGCVRSFQFGEDIVTCEDISRGGLRFKSNKPYVARTDIQICAPYSPGAHAIFIPAQIVRVVELKGERRFSCGVCYTNP